VPDTYRELKMKKIISITVFTLICGLLFTSCGGGGNSPSSVVKKALNAHKQKNVEELSKYFYDISDSDKVAMRRYYFEKFDYDKCLRQNSGFASDSEVESYCREVAVNFEKYRNDIEIVKFEIQDERIFDNGEKAEVVVKIFYRGGEEHTEKMQLMKTSNGWKFELYDYVYSVNGLYKDF
jgi:hypothetical protein